MFAVSEAQQPLSPTHNLQIKFEHRKWLKWVCFTNTEIKAALNQRDSPNNSNNSVPVCFLFGMHMSFN